VGRMSADAGPVYFKACAVGTGPLSVSAARSNCAANSLRKASAETCTLWVSKTGYVSVQFPQPSCEEHDLVLVLDTKTDGKPCQPCRLAIDCGGPEDLCVRNNSTGVRFCASACSTGADCPSGYTCTEITRQGTTVSQCIPEGGVCPIETATCDQGCPDGTVCRAGRCVSEADLTYCIEVINGYRALVGQAPVQRSEAIEEYAAEGAYYDAQQGTSHAHFRDVSNFSLVDAENEIPGWDLGSYATIANVIDKGTEMMWGEGPGGGHYENIKGSHTKAGCGVYVTPSNRVWLIQDFK
jgi:uncharacterized protein YkwD